MSAVAPTLQAFFTERLLRQRRASPHTIAAYRDTIRLLLTFVSERHGKAPCRLDFDDLDAATITAFLEHLETARGNSARTRNARLAAIRSLFRFAALRHPEHAALIGQVLAVPQKRHDKGLVSFLTHDEIDALLDAPDSSTWEGRRDWASPRSVEAWSMRSSHARDTTEVRRRVPGGGGPDRLGDQEADRPGRS
jgi:site-specific recombinase XerD